MKALILSTFFVSAQALAWGPTGHRVVGEIAEKFMAPEKLLMARSILNGQTLARVSTWPDEIRSEPTAYSYTFNWHFTDWADDDHDHDETSSSGLLLTAINKQLQVLADPEALKDKKVFALKFLVHLVGDLHMPLHVGNGLDRGGNDCKVKFHRQETNLHALWDDLMIDFTRLSYTELTNFAMMGRTVSELESWKQGTALDWARESRELRAEIYPQEVTTSDANYSVKQYCRRDIQVTKEDMPALSYEYSYRFVPIIETRLVQAGVRLAQMLNQAL